MPELPEVEALARFVADQAGGQEITRVEVAALSALKTYDPPVSALVGRLIQGATRRGKHLAIDTGGIWLVTHLSRGGWLHWRDALPPGRAKPGKGPLALRVGLSSGAGFDLTEQGTEKRLAVWLVRDLAEVPGIARLGPDPLDPNFDEATLLGALTAAGGQLKSVLADQAVIAGVGNAYSDEILHAARLSPFKSATKLTADEGHRLYQAFTAVLRSAVERSVGLAAGGLKGEKRSGLAVHGRTGQACPVCGDTIREVSYASRSFQYCPTCQTGGKPLADRRLSRLLK
jgi:formamidopyrimidine-DNA glycosylase